MEGVGQADILSTRTAQMPTTLKVKIKSRWYTVEVDDVESSPVTVYVDGAPVEVQIGQSGDDAPPAAPAVETEDGSSPVSGAVVDAVSRDHPDGSTRAFSTPMSGVIVSVAVGIGDQVVTGDEVCVLEAMKMQQVLRADWTGIVRTVHVQAGQQVMDGDPIVELE